MHTVKDTILRPYNDSIFDLRSAYSKIFPEPELQVKDKNNNGRIDTGESEESSDDNAKVILQKINPLARNA